MPHTHTQHTSTMDGLRRIIREEIEAYAGRVQPVRRPFGGYRAYNTGRYARQGTFQDHTDRYDSTYRAKNPGAPSYRRVMYSEPLNMLVAFPEDGNPTFDMPYIVLGLKVAAGYGRDHRHIDHSIKGAGMFYVGESAAEDAVERPVETLKQMGSAYVQQLTPERPTVYMDRTDGGVRPMQERAQSRSQQRLFGLVHAYKKGEVDLGDLGDDLADTIARIAGNISAEDAEEFASTSHDGLPETISDN